MQSAGVKRREIKFLSKKNNNELLIVHSDAARRFAKRLEDDLNVASYAVCKLLVSERLDMIQKVDIKKRYFETEWETDFYIVYNDKSVAVREISSEVLLSKHSEVVKLELSRRYWKSVGVTDWKIVIEERERTCSLK